MTIRTVHARVRARRQLDLAEDIDLPDGSDVVVTLDVAESASPAPRDAVAGSVVTFDTYDLGTFLPLTRSTIYDEVG